MSESANDRLAGIRGFSPQPWALIPDLGLYMDQVITFITRAYEPLYGEAIHGYLSAAMINNYVKARLIPRPTGKKYSRDQIALLTMIVALKQVCSMEDIRAMLTLKGGETVEALYEAFCQRFHRVVRSIHGENESDQPASALDFAILSTGYSAACAALLKSEKAETP